MDAKINRRPLKIRSRAWALELARAASRAGIGANAISLAGVGFAGLGAAAFLLTPQGWYWWLVAALAIQLRLLANMLDGLVAVECGRASPKGPLFNEVPDRIEDVLLLVTAGYVTGMAELGWLAALLALATAYARLLGGSLSLAQSFAGPMAKQHRMAALTLAALASAALPGLPVMAVMLVLIAAGTALTFALRLRRIAHALEAR
ncbi:MAG: CDP-alcohol phosphatidyltransferase family protein [Novosphingobium sp.]|nr:CDP-alcohol phosphatidyltransferase family protein [Novosphingobium sp.]